ncbi:hypothetical protein BGZ70_009301 [Mortierella alpina]|uniref:FAD-binding domain-containing protein n=1 Tax=Mortierella alpina TaxID=64518 RepID=A0A9P6M0U3_MORAP|nr:hypothetical protein BGZ70_009301 [Mortierella alpina]
MTVNATILPIFEQLGMLEELLSLSMSFESLDICNENMEKIMSLDMRESRPTTGYDSIVFTRAELHNLLSSKVPSSKITMGKKIMSLEQNHLGVMIRASDGETFHGDILVGADGAYSGVRQAMYKKIEKKGKLPDNDKEDFHVGFICMVGTTGPLDPERYPDLKSDIAKFTQVVGKNKPYSWTVISIPGHRVSWSVKLQLDSAAHAKSMMFRNSEWGPESNEDMIKDIYNFPIPFGGVLGHLIDATPRELISKVYLEEGLFDTWHHGRTCLIGDACHKMLPSAGQGAISAMQDAIVLVNCIYDIEENTPQAIKSAFEEYQSLRYPRAKQQFEMSKMMGKLLIGQSIMDRFARHIFANYVPRSILLRNFAKSVANRPVAAFLPPVENRGSASVEPQQPSKRHLRERALTSAV